MQQTLHSDMEIWVQFFKNASIPNQFVNTYASKFNDNRIRFDMLADLDRGLLNEMGITAIGDCLSILKHAKEINCRMEENKKEYMTTSKESHLTTVNSKKRCEVAKDMIKTFLNDNDTNPSIAEKPTSSTLAPKIIKTTTTTVDNNINTASSTLSQSLISRLNLKSNSNFNTTTTSPVSSKITAVTSKDHHQAKIVSSTTEDHDDNELQSSKLKSLKRRINQVYINNEDTNSNSDNDDHSIKYKSVISKPVNEQPSKIISLKSKRTTSLNEPIKLNTPIRSDLAPTSAVDPDKAGINRKISSNFEGLRIQVHNNNEKKSVFNRIRSTTEPANNKNIQSVPIKKISEFNKETKNIKPILNSLNRSASGEIKKPNSVPPSTSKIISLNRKANSKLQMDKAANSNAKNVHDRIKFI